MTEQRSRRKTGNGPTMMRGVRIEADIWDPALARAAKEGTDLSTVMRDAVKRFAETGDAEYQDGTR